MDSRLARLGLAVAYVFVMAIVVGMMCRPKLSSELIFLPPAEHPILEQGLIMALPRCVPDWAVGLFLNLIRRTE